MSGLEIAGLVLAVYPVLASLATRLVRSAGNEYCSLARDVKVMEVVYDHICKRLLDCALTPEEARIVLPKHDYEHAWKHPGIQKRLLDRLGQKEYGLVVNILADMKTLLDEVAKDLKIMCNEPTPDGRGRFRTGVRAFVSRIPRQGDIKTRIRQIKDLNDDLERLLKDNASPLPWTQYQSSAITNFPLETKHGAQELFDAIRDTYTCSCITGHLVGVGCHCSSCSQPLKNRDHDLHAGDEWDFALACVDSEASTAASPGLTTVLLESVQGSQCDNGILVPNIPDFCSFVHSAANIGTTITTTCETVIGLTSKTNINRSYRMKVTKVGSTASGVQPISYFTDLVQSNRGISPKDRFELALKLSIAIAQLCQTPWVSDSWTWTDVCVQSQASPVDTEALLSSADSSSVKFPVVYILQKIYSPTVLSSKNPGRSATAKCPGPMLAELVDDEPILTKLGLALIELVVCQSIQEIKSEYPAVQIGNDDHLTNFLTAKALLKDHKILNGAPGIYEKVVDTCITRRYRDLQGNTKSLESSDISFMSCFNEAVVKPLLDVCKMFECVG